MVTLSQVRGAGAYSGTFTLTAVGGPVSFSIAEPAGSNLTLSASGGTLAAGQSQTITVTASPNNPPSYDTDLVVSPGDITITVQYLPSG